MQKKYNDYIDSVDALRDTVGKLKVQSVKIKEGIGKWKQQQRISTNLLQEFLNNQELNSLSDDDDCLEASSSTPSDADYETYDDYHDAWTQIINPPSPDRQCRFVHHERKCPPKTRSPISPFQSPKNLKRECRDRFRRQEIQMETPMLNENSMLARKINDLQNQSQNHKNRKQSIDERITHLRREIRSLIRQDIHYDTIGDAKVELNSPITEGAWVEKELVRISTKVNDLRKHQGFTKVARAFMATVANADDPFQITTSVIQPN
jgi:phosphopantetheine adenylyltransferase